MFAYGKLNPGGSAFIVFSIIGGNVRPSVRTELPRNEVRPAWRLGAVRPQRRSRPRFGFRQDLRFWGFRGDLPTGLGMGKGKGQLPSPGGFRGKHHLGHEMKQREIFCGLQMANLIEMD